MPVWPSIESGCKANELLSPPTSALAPKPSPKEAAALPLAYKLNRNESPIVPERP